MNRLQSPISDTAHRFDIHIFDSYGSKTVNKITLYDLLLTKYFLFDDDDDDDDGLRKYFPNCHNVVD